MATYRLGVDVGGTFTDLVLLNEETGQITSTKVLTTAPNPAGGVIAGIRQALAETGVESEGIGAILHGTTLVTNSLLERKGPRTALLTTRGFRDVLEIGRQIRPQLFDWFADKPEPLVPRRWRYEISERVTRDGTVLARPAAAELAAVADHLRTEGIEALAICFLFSFLRPEHEEMAAAAVRASLPSLFISLSSRVLPEYREYERASTTVANAFVTPILAQYIGELVASLGELGLSARLRLLQSNGGLAAAEAVKDQAITTALSGPAGGVTAAAHLAARLNISNVISVDMGGTSCDVCLIRDGLPRWTVEAAIADLPVRTPMMEVNTVGAGGGSIIWVDSGGALRVGPQSAGSHPGPACYGQGGTQPTLTDAHLALGTIRPEGLVEKGVRVDRQAALDALSKIAYPLGLSWEQVAAGAVRVANQRVAQAIRAVSVMKGYDLRDFTLVAFGGAGPLHACFIAEELGIGRIVLPEAAGVFSALGAALADFRYDLVQTRLRRWGDVTEEEIAGAFHGLKSLAGEKLAGLPIAGRRLDYSLDLRYIGQSFELNVPIALSDERMEPRGGVLERFHLLHQESYGYCDPGAPVEVVNLRLSAIGLTAKPTLGRGEVGKPLFPPSEVPIPFLEERGPGKFRLWDRAELRPGDQLAGPAIVGDRHSTALVLPGWKGRVDAQGNIVLLREGS